MVRTFPAQLNDAAFYGARNTIGSAILHFVIDLRRPLDEESLASAVVATSDHFPILRCRYQARFWRDRWVAHAERDPREVVSQLWAEHGFEEATARLMEVDIDPLHSQPWRVTLIGDRQRCRLVVSILHQLVDAAGGWTIVRALASHLADPHAPITPDDHERSANQIFKYVPFRRLPKLVGVALVEWLRPVMLFPFLARTTDKAKGQTYEKLQFENIAIDVGPQSPARQLCRAHECTINDLLVAALARVIKDISAGGMVAGLYTVNMRRHLPDSAPRLTNLSVINVVVLQRRQVGTLAQAMLAARRITTHHKANFVGVPQLMGTLPGAWLPHALLRYLFTPMVLSYARLIMTRGLLVTNVGAVDHYLAPLGADVERAAMYGPFVKGVQIPVITVTGFQDRLTVHVSGFVDAFPQLHREVVQRLRAVLHQAGDPA